ncbi:hypothetical protein MKW98_004837, partial [Papaver atlanticum]
WSGKTSYRRSLAEEVMLPLLKINHIKARNSLIQPLLKAPFSTTAPSPPQPPPNECVILVLFGSPYVYSGGTTSPNRRMMIFLGES